MPSKGPFYVYRLWNVLTGKEYIGQCININDRFKRHKAKPLTELRIDVKEAGAFFDCVFSMDILHTCQLKHVADHLEETEIYKRGTHKPRGYNILRGTPGKDYRMSAIRRPTEGKKCNQNTPILRSTSSLIGLIRT